MAYESKGSVKKKVIFLCFHNSARSQIAEGLLKSTYGNRYEVHSAGVEASKLDPRAVKVMSEIGIDISGQRSKTMNEYKGILFDLAVTVCDKAKELCPICGTSLGLIPRLQQPRRPSIRISKIQPRPEVRKKIRSTSSGKQGTR